MKRKWFLIPVVVVVGVWAWSTDRLDPAPLAIALGLKTSPTAAAKQKPICASPVNPNVAAPVDCIPERIANLPPDPGKAGETQFIDTNGDGLRDDVERYIEVNYGHSRRAVAALRQVAKQYQDEIAMSGNVTTEEAYAFANATMKVAGCYIKSVPENIINDGANERVGTQVLNTPERYLAAKKFERLLHGGVFDMDTSPLAEQCGYDPDQLPN